MITIIARWLPQLKNIFLFLWNTYTIQGWWVWEWWWQGKENPNLEYVIFSVNKEHNARGPPTTTWLVGYLEYSNRSGWGWSLALANEVFSSGGKQVSLARSLCICPRGPIVPFVYKAIKKHTWKNETEFQSRPACPSDYESLCKWEHSGENSRWIQLSSCSSWPWKSILHNPFPSISSTMLLPSTCHSQGMHIHLTSRKRTTRYVD